MTTTVRGISLPQLCYVCTYLATVYSILAVCPVWHGVAWGMHGGAMVSQSVMHQHTGDWRSWEFKLPFARG